MARGLFPWLLCPISFYQSLCCLLFPSSSAWSLFFLVCSHHGAPDDTGRGRLSPDRAAPRVSGHDVYKCFLVPLKGTPDLARSLLLPFYRTSRFKMRYQGLLLAVFSLFVGINAYWLGDISRQCSYVPSFKLVSDMCSRSGSCAVRWRGV